MKISIKNHKKLRKAEADKRRVDLFIKGTRIVIIDKINGIIEVNIMRIIESKRRIIKKSIILARKREVLHLKVVHLLLNQAPNPVIPLLDHDFMIICFIV